jgi:hypothetical protein
VLGRSRLEEIFGESSSCLGFSDADGLSRRPKKSSTSYINDLFCYSVRLC